MKNEWSGDIDLNDGTVHKLHHEYVGVLEFPSCSRCKSKEDTRSFDVRFKAPPGRFGNSPYIFVFQQENLLHFF